MQPPDYLNVIVDVHTYNCYIESASTVQLPAFLNRSCTFDVQSRRKQPWPVFTGEWSLCYRAGMIPIQSLPSAQDQLFLRKFATAQIAAYETAPNSVGWTFYNFKTESNPLYSYIDGVENGWLPCQLPIVEPEASSGCKNLTNPYADKLWCNHTVTVTSGGLTTVSVTTVGTVDSSTGGASPNREPENSDAVVAACQISLLLAILILNFFL